MNILDDTMLVYHVAKHYYIDGYSQSEIAKMMGISRPQISRLIKKSSELGIVKIDVCLPEIINVRQLEDELTKCLDIDSVCIIPSDLNNTMENFSKLAAQKLPNFLEGKTNIGIGWGRSLYGVSINLEYQKNSGCVYFYPLIGCSGDNNKYLQVNTITDRFSEKYFAKAHYLNLLAFEKNENITPCNNEKISFFKEIWDKLDIAVVGIGSYEGEEHLYIDEVSYDPYLLKNANRIKGDILSHLLLEDGKELELTNYNHISCPLEALKKIPTVVAIAKGVEKTNIIYHTAKNGYITTLITDEITAKEIIKQH